jgi:uncharacterized repeat protein (TIGR03803 family)
MRLIEHASSIGAVVVLLLVSLAQGATENTLYNFDGNGDGMYPYCSPVFDSKGNLYGTTLLGGTHNAGMVFELSPGESGQWVETVLYEFTGKSDGGYPMAGLVFDSEGNLYGTGENGGAYGTGVVFELSPQGGGWTYTVLYSFGGYSDDGADPNSTLVFDKMGNLYGVTSLGGNGSCSGGCGTVFELSPTEGGGWNEQVIHSFEANGTDGELPTGGVTVVSNGDLYGTTQNGGTAGSGVLYQLEYSSKDKEWIESVLHQFVGGSNDGSFPINVILIEHAKKLYGTTQGGGANSQGTVFETSLSKKTIGETTILYSFGPEYSGDGTQPEAGLTMDKGNLYGTTYYGGEYNYDGTVFKLFKSKNDNWKEAVLFSFDGNNGFYPEAGLTINGGWLYGTTSNGDDFGTVFQVKP